MNIKNIIKTLFLTIIVLGIIIFTGFSQNDFKSINTVYKVYLDGKSIGLIPNDTDLYDLINKDQVELKNEYKVDQVYPPNGFDIVKYNTYNDQITNPETVYSKIKEEKQFTVKGYVFTIDYPDAEKEDKQIYVLDKQIFDDAMYKLVYTFIQANKFEAYLNGKQAPIVDVGSIIKSIKFEEKITSKEAYIDADQKIYTDVNELAQYILFGTNQEQETYTVKEGDTIESISYDHKLNSQEFLVANPRFSSEKDLLALNDKVVISLINPIVSLSYDMEITEDNEINFETETKVDNSKNSSYRVVEQPGQKGLMRITKKTIFVNGAEQQGNQIINEKTLKEPIKQIVVTGRKNSGNSYLPPNISSGNYVDNGMEWAWPTNSPYTLSSPFGYRWGTLHDGMDISGTGYGSPIYASAPGTVIASGSIGGWASGIAVAIDHHNGYYTVYAHMSKTNVSVGQTVDRRQIIGAMGNTGMVSPRPSASAPYAGTHLHFSVFRGYPYQGGSAFNPRVLFN